MWIEGSAIRSDTCIGINWHYIIFPACLIVLEVVLLVATIERGRRAAWKGDWKSSPIPLLFAGPGGDGGGGITAQLEAGKMYKQSKLLDVQLCPDAKVSGAWRLEEVRRRAEV